jgi:hypothetical protein
MTAAAAFPRLRLAAFALFALLAAATTVEVVQHGHWGAAVAGITGPDVALMFGAGAGLAQGQLHPRAVGAYNLLHRVWLPLLLTVLGASGVLGTAALVGGLAWLTHVAMDRTAGYGLRTPEGFQRGH